MRYSATILLLALAAGCGKSQAQKKLDDFFVEWLEHHGEKQIVTDAGGVGLAGNATRLKASLYDSKKHANGCTVETEFRIALPGGGEIVEFVAGMGDTEAEAVQDSLANFTLTTFHVVYKCFLNDADPRQTLQPLTIGGVQRDVAFGDLYLRGTPGQNHDLNKLRPAIEKAIADLSLDSGPHWIKIVYGQNQGQIITVAATLDNNDAAALTEAVKQLGWPQTDGFYMAKQFIVVK